MICTVRNHLLFVEPTGKPYAHHDDVFTEMLEFILQHKVQGTTYRGNHVTASGQSSDNCDWFIPILGMNCYVTNSLAEYYLKYYRHTREVQAQLSLIDEIYLKLTDLNTYLNKLAKEKTNWFKVYHDPKYYGDVKYFYAEVLDKNVISELFDDNVVEPSEKQENLTLWEKHKTYKLWA